MLADVQVTTCNKNILKELYYMQDSCSMKKTHTEKSNCQLIGFCKFLELNVKNQANFEATV